VNLHMLNVLWLALSIAVTPPCPLEGLWVLPDAVGWAELRIGMSLEEVHAVTGGPLEIRGKDLSEGTGTTMHGNPLSFGFRRVNGRWGLTSISLLRSPASNSYCWSSAELSRMLKQKVPHSRYLPSRHNPELSERDNETPMFVVHERQQVVVLLKAKEGRVFIGNVSELD
jgi:hypothetical protein